MCGVCILLTIHDIIGRPLPDVRSMKLNIPQTLHGTAIGLPPLFNPSSTTSGTPVAVDRQSESAGNPTGRVCVEQVHPGQTAPGVKTIAVSDQLERTRDVFVFVTRRSAAAAPRSSRASMKRKSNPSDASTASDPSTRRVAKDWRRRTLMERRERVWSAEEAMVFQTNGFWVRQKLHVCPNPQSFSFTQKRKHCMGIIAAHSQIPFWCANRFPV